MESSDVKERPILMNGPMVRATLADIKTQTRRVMKSKWFEIEETPHGLFYSEYDPPRWHRLRASECDGGRTLAGRGPFNPSSQESQLHAASFCPYGQVGDRLYVRETWRSYPMAGNASAVIYRADPQHAHLGPWKPSIHMPRWASRITLEITHTRPERLQSISEADAWAEGVLFESHIDYRRTSIDGGAPLHSHAVDLYRALWESINGPGSWDANPYVWAITFKRIDNQPTGATAS